MERERIVVGVDGSAGSQQALRWALDEACRRPADVEIVCCWPLSLVSASNGYALAYVTDEEVAAAGHVCIDEMTTACREEMEAGNAAGIDVSTTVLEGDAASSLISESKGAALLVVGRRGHGGLSRLVLGSVSRHIASPAHCPVVVVPESD
jgi:nucleotide-binding universal stress UspA family protein